MSNERSPHDSLLKGFSDAERSRIEFLAYLREHRGEFQGKEDMNYYPNQEFTTFLSTQEEERYEADQVRQKLISIHQKLLHIAEAEQGTTSYAYQPCINRGISLARQGLQPTVKSFEKNNEVVAVQYSYKNNSVRLKHTWRYIDENCRVFRRSDTYQIQPTGELTAETNTYIPELDTLTTTKHQVHLTDRYVNRSTKNIVTELAYITSSLNKKLHSKGS